MAQNNPYRVPNGAYFEPSDSEIVYYLDRKNRGLPLPPDLIEEFDIYTCSPDELIGKFQYGKEKELYFFVPRNLEKSRTERTVKQDYGFWKLTGNIKICIGRVILQKGTLNFHTKIAKGKHNQTHWKMHEYSLASESSSMDQTSSGLGAKGKRVGRFTLCKIFVHKTKVVENPMQTQVVENPMGGMQVGDGDGSNDPDSGPSSWAIEDMEAWLATIQRR